ncbi:unnamed protein product [Ilex paraguariensis]|uniref:Uncharacterized protein n=1 Tax=Ilex paraguariensis TaxID=185542 RepID=A0ABC8V4K0_9AQUA
MDSGPEDHQAQPLYPISNEDYNAAEILLMLEDSNPLEAATKSLHSLTYEALRLAREQEDGLQAELEDPLVEPEFSNHVHGAGESLPPPEINLILNAMKPGPEDYQAQPSDPISNEDYNAVEILLMLEDSNPLEVASQSLHSLTDEALRPASE